MKSSLIIAAGGALLLSACSPIKIRPATTAQPTGPQQTATATPQVPATPAYPQPTVPQTYPVTQPVQPVYTTDPATGQPVMVQPAPTAQPTYAIDPVTGQPILVQPVAPVQPTYTVDPVTGQPVLVQPTTPAYPAPTQPGMGTVTGVPAVDPSQPAAQPTLPAPTPQPAAGAGANYAVQMINGTTGRLFVEVFDDSDNVFPVGYMFAGANLSTPPSEARPIQGQLTVVIRDPDKPDAPELRRYKVAPPADYTGKTIGITILPGGRYRASLDGQVYYTSPDPKTPAPTSAPAPASEPAPAPAPAPTPAPAADPAAPSQIL